MGRLNSVIPAVGLMVLAMITGCSTSRPPAAHIPPPPSISQQNGSAISGPAEERTSRDIVVQYAVKSIGAPYAWGGDAPADGFDCSGLARFTHSRAGVTLPRTARAQFYQGRAVHLKDLQPGDLVFFRSSPKKSGYHVGIYTGRHQFVHAPGKGRKVIRSSLSNPYFKQHYIGARSFL